MSKKIKFIIIIIIIVIGIAYFINKKEDAFLPAESTLSTIATTTETYSHPTLNFTFDYPSSFSASSFTTEDGMENIVVQEITTGKGFQVSISPIDEDIPALTVERIRKDLPNLLIESPQDVILGDAGKGVAFISNDSAFDGRSREVWFVLNRNLYQIRTYIKYDEVLKAVLSSWKFDTSAVNSAVSQEEVFDQEEEVVNEEE